MKCEQAYLLLSAHLDGENTPEEEAALTRHLHDCPACRALLAAYEAADSGLAELEAEPPRALCSGVMNRIHGEATGVVQPKKRRFFFGPGTAIAAVAAALLLILGTGNFQNLTMGKSAAGDMAMPADAPVTEAAPEPRTAAAQKPMSAPQPASIQAAPQANNALIAPPETDAPRLRITENAEKPALETITQLAELPMQTDEAGEICYVTDAKTARTIEATYGADYKMEAHLLGSETQDQTTCLITVQ